MIVTLLVAVLIKSPDSVSLDVEPKTLESNP